MRTDEDLMQQVASGEYEAFEELVRRHQSTAIGLAYNLVNDPSRAEEIAQEAFLKILRNAESYEPTASFKTYLSRVVSRLCYDHYEKNKPTSYDPTEAFGNESDATSPLEETLDGERREAIQAALDELPKRQRTAIVLQTLEDFTYEEIADTMDTTTKAVERLLARARKTLRKDLIDRVEIEHPETPGS